MLEEAKNKLKELVEEYNNVNQAIVNAQNKLSELRLEIAEQQGYVKGLESQTKEKKSK